MSTTILDEIYNVLLSKVISNIKPNLNSGISFTTDFWTDDIKQISYCSLTAHLIDSAFNLKTYILKIINYDEKKTAANIKNLILDTIKNFFNLSDYELNTFMSNNNYSFVTDNGANIVAALREYSRISCAGHNINLIIEYFLKNLPENHEIAELLHSCKNLVGYFKRSGLNNKLKNSLKQSVPTRWNSTLHMLKSIKESYNDCLSLLEGQRELKKVTDVDTFLLKDLINLLDYFDIATNELSKDTSPTLPYVYPWYLKLDQYLSNFDTKNIDSLEKSVELLKKGLVDKYIVKDIHKVATVFEPKMKSLEKNCNFSEKQKIYEKALADMEMFLLTTEGNEPSTTFEEPPPKKVAVNINKELSEFFDTETTASDVLDGNLKQEFTSYINSSIDPEPTISVLEFWKTNEKKFPRISKYAKQILCIPATSTPSERLFSIAGQTLNKRRSALKPEKLDKLLFIKYNYSNV